MLLETSIKRVTAYLDHVTRLVVYHSRWSMLLNPRDHPMIQQIMICSKANASSEERRAQPKGTDMSFSDVGALLNDSFATTATRGKHGTFDTQCPCSQIIIPPYAAIVV